MCQSAFQAVTAVLFHKPLLVRKWALSSHCPNHMITRAAARPAPQQETAGETSPRQKRPTKDVRARDRWAGSGSDIGWCWTLRTACTAFNRREAERSGVTTGIVGLA